MWIVAAAASADVTYTLCVSLYIHLYSPKHGSNNNKETKTNTTKDNYINIPNSNLTITI